MNKIPEDISRILTHYGGTEESVMGKRLKCPKCKIELQLVKIREPYNDGYLICPKCDGTYNLEQYKKCSCGFLPSGGMEYNSKCPIHGIKK